MSTFAELSLSPQMLAAVSEMGFTNATDIQAQSIPVIRTGADVLAKSQTGTGKTLAFGIPAIEAIDPKDPHVQVLVLSPTRELAHQCGEELRKLSRYIPKIKVANILGGGDYGRQFRDLQTANLIMGTPGRVMDHMERGTLDLSQLKMVILDEADEMLNMGFREDIEFILQDVPGDRQIVLFSATFPEAILAIADDFQKNPVRIEINREKITLENIKQTFVEVPSKQKIEALSLLLHYYQPQRAIIFSNTKTMVDTLAGHLSSAGFSVEGLHGDMKQLQRTTVMNGFRNGRISILIATDVAARGIDVSDIDYVINFDIPRETDYYVHRIGRTGRAGRAGTAITICSSRNQVLHLQRLGRETKSVVTPISLPTVAEIEEENRNRTVRLIEKAMGTQPLPIHQEMVGSLKRLGYDPEDIAVALLGMYFLHDTEKLTDIAVPEREGRKRREKERSRENKKGKSGRKDEKTGVKSGKSSRRKEKSFGKGTGANSGKSGGKSAGKTREKRGKRR